ncbi:MAG: NUDIX domain-containing protein [Clostridia bacterium]|nr:NUDIX domain-containing protein [Clostridia bacterium]
MKSYLGKIVTVQIDRPFGSRHPHESDIVYPVNYGYIPDTLSGDGEAIDAYVLGVSEPVDTFTGRVIAVIERKNDSEDKLVVAPEELKINQAEIEEAVHFQEKYFDSSVCALYQKSCGAVVIRTVGGRKEYLLLLQKGSKTWSFPKGHMEMGEKEEETAVREVFEETGLIVKPEKEFRHVLEYALNGGIQKTVVLFLCKTDRQPVPNPNEIEKCVWAGKQKAKTIMHPAYCEIIESAETH